MKKRHTILAFLFATISILAQSPEKMSYQAVLRDATNTLLTNQEVGMQVSILQTTITGTRVYIETQTVTTNINGLVSLEIGSGTSSDDFSAIDWSTGPYFIKTATDPSGGSSYTITGTSQIMSVPFAMYAKTSGSSIPGPQGAAGTQGIQGLAGTVGATGARGAVGTSGTQGIQGTAGSDGTDGATGLTGAVGTSGTQGIQGTAGSDGIDGSVGATGAVGTQGIQGTAGSDGIDGSVGATGAVGTQGIQGTAGSDGTDGADGADGTQPTYTLNTFASDLGGYVIQISPDGKHGLVVAMQNQGSSNWYLTNNLVNDPANHDDDGKKFSDWRLPTQRELVIIHTQKGSIGNFDEAMYWNTAENANDDVDVQFFDEEEDDFYSFSKDNSANIRAVRAF